MRAPIVVSFSTREPRPTTTSSRDLDALPHARLVAEDHALADRRAGEDDRARGDDRAGPDHGRRERLALRGRARRERRLLPDDGVLEHPDALAEDGALVDDRGRVDVGAHAGAPVRSDVVRRSSVRTTASPSCASRWSPGPSCTSRRKCCSSSLQGLVVRDLRAEDVARPRPPLAVARRGLPRRLLVDGHLALELHVVEDDHLLAADHGHLAHLVRVEPREVHVGDAARREAEEAEDDVLDPLLQVVHPVRDRLARLLLEEPEDDGEVVDAERPQRVLVRADHAEVLAVAVDARDLAERPLVDELLHHAGGPGGRGAGGRA